MAYLVAFLIVFHVLLVIVLWAYAKATLTPAGLARDVSITVA